MLSPDMVKVIMMQAYFCMSNPIVEVFVGLSEKKLVVSLQFSYQNVEKDHDPERSEKHLNEILRIMNKYVDSMEKMFFADRIGDPGNVKINYELKRSQQRVEIGKRIYSMKQYDFTYSTQEWLETYHIRSISEKNYFLERQSGHTQSLHNRDISLRVFGSTLTVVHQQIRGEPHVKAVPHISHVLITGIIVHKSLIFTVSLRSLYSYTNHTWIFLS